MLLTLVLIVVLQIPFRGVQATFIVSPASINASVGAMVEFTCTMILKNGWEIFSVSSTLSLSTYTLCTSKSVLPEIQETVTLSFIALTEHNAGTVTCVAININSIQLNFTETALLLVQGKLSAVSDLTSTKLARDDCILSVHFTWTAPYTLQGVPINYYTINITRHSDGAVLRADTTNTTEYLYDVSIMGETLEIAVAAVNDVGIGNLTKIFVQPSSDNASQFDMILEKRERHNKNWTYYFLISEKEKICDNFGTISVNVFKDSVMVGSTNDTTIVAISDGKRMTAHFTNLSENEHFLATASVSYPLQVTQHSNHVAISTYDVWRVDYAISFETINFTVDYVNGSKYLHQFYIELQCVSKTLAELFNGSFGLISSVPPDEMCTLRVTDGDAAETIRTKAAYLIKRITVPAGATANNNSTITTSATSTTVTTEVPVSIAESLVLSPSIAVFTVAIIVILVIAVIVLTAIVITIFFILHRKGLLCHKDSEKNATTTVTENTISASYENVNPLTQSTEIDPDYENMSAFEMKECAGCKSDPDYENASAFIMKECAAYKDVNKSVPDYENIPNFKMSKCSAYGVTNKTV